MEQGWRRAEYTSERGKREAGRGRGGGCGEKPGRDSHAQVTLQWTDSRLRERGRCGKGWPGNVRGDMGD